MARYVESQSYTVDAHKLILSHPGHQGHVGGDHQPREEPYDQTDRDASLYHLAARCEAGEAQDVNPDCVTETVEQTMPACLRDEEAREQSDPVPDTFLNTLCPTIPGPVVRLDEFHPNYDSIETNRTIPTGLNQDDLRSNATEDANEAAERLESSKRMDSQKDG